MIRFQQAASLAILVAVALRANAAPGVAPVEVELKASCSVGKTCVTIGDVALLKGGSEEQRQRMKQMDLADCPAVGQTLVIKARQVEFRLLLADVAFGTYRLTGSSAVTVNGPRSTASSGLSAEAVEQAAREALMRRLPFKPEELSITLAEPIALDLSQIADFETPLLKAEPHSTGVGLGKSEIDVSIYTRGERRQSLTVHFEVKHRQQVGVGREVEPKTPPANESAIVIQPKQPIKMLVRTGEMNKVTDGEAMQAGRVGQIIRVQFIDSKKFANARVMGPQIVEVDNSTP